MSFNHHFRGPEYEFTEPGSLIFVTGAPLSGKSTVSPLISSSIEGCVSQNMDMFRLLMGREDELLPAHLRNPVLQYGSCDSFLAIGNGDYSEELLLKGFVANSTAICAPLEYVIPKLEVQGAQNVLFEGVQLLPSIVDRFMKSNLNSRYLIVTSSGDTFDERRASMYKGESLEFGKKYARDRLLAIEKYIVDEASQLPNSSVCLLENTSVTAEDVASEALRFLCSSGLVKQKNKT